MIVLNEPYIDQCTIEKTKVILEGQPTPVPAKHQAEAHLRRTPVFVTCNKPLWRFANAEKEAIDNRSFVYRNLTTYPELKHVAKDGNSYSNTNLINTRYEQELDEFVYDETRGHFVARPNTPPPPPIPNPQSPISDHGFCERSENSEEFNQFVTAVEYHAPKTCQTHGTTRCHNADNLTIAVIPPKRSTSQTISYT